MKNSFARVHNLHIRSVCKGQPMHGMEGSTQTRSAHQPKRDVQFFLMAGLAGDASCPTAELLSRVELVSGGHVQSTHSWL